MILKNFSQSNSSWPKSSCFLQLLWWWLTWSFCSNVLWGFGHPSSCSIHSFSCSLLCSGHFRCWIEQGVCKMTVIHVLLLRCLSSQKSQPSIGSICHQLIILAVNQTSKLLLGRLCLQGCLVYDCNHPNTQLHIET